MKQSRAACSGDGGCNARASRWDPAASRSGEQQRTIFLYLPAEQVQSPVGLSMSYDVQASKLTEQHRECALIATHGERWQNLGVAFGHQPQIA